MNVLAIGNSFSEDATRYLHGIARADGKDLTVVNLYIGGCSLERHYRNMLSDKPAYELQCNGQRTGFFVSLREALLNRCWDVVTLQQASHFSFDAETYRPYVSELAAFVRKHSPKARLYIHQTWAYEDGSSKLLGLARYDRSEQMLREVTAAYGEIAAEIRADGIIPSGTLFGSLLSRNVAPLYRDGFHASRGIGRYALALLWYATLTHSESVSENTFCDFDEPIEPATVQAIKDTVSALL